MKRKGSWIKRALFACAVLLIGSFLMGNLLIKAQMEGNAKKWVQEQISAEIPQFEVVDRRDYGDYAVLLVHDGTGRGGYLLSYKKIPVMPIYTRHIFADAENKKLVGIGFDSGKNQYMELLISPPYTEIQVRGEDGNLSPAP